MKVYTIGFTGTTAKEFFEKLKQHGVQRLIDVRLNNSSQLSAFAKKQDLAYFLGEICGADYIHMPLLAPTQEMLDDYKKQKGSWQNYSERFVELMRERKIERSVERSIFDVPSVLLCSEHEAKQCHRRLVLEYLNEHWNCLSIVHL